MTDIPPAATTERADRLVGLTAAGVGLVFLGAGLWAFADPRSFFDQAATFEPYNTHLIRDIGAFQLGLGAVLLLATWLRDALLAALAGVAVGAIAHTAAHIIDRDLGGQPGVDIPAFGLIAVLLIVAAAARHRTSDR
jgi:peptidoglycan/LPS O-acetylase OafA/YrhL